MLFNSFQFIFEFLPATLLAFYVAAHLSRSAAAFVLVIASLYFYAQWHFRSLYLLSGSIAVNYAIGMALAASGDRLKSDTRRKAVLIAGIAANLACLAYFKYGNFLIDTVNTLLSEPLPARHITLPLGISFFTFTQIAYPRG
jgi:alginate O-acetyltransferase complex protein AlgI